MLRDLSFKNEVDDLIRSILIFGYILIVLMISGLARAEMSCAQVEMVPQALPLLNSK